MKRDIKVLIRLLKEVDKEWTKKNWQKLLLRTEVFTRCWDAVVHTMYEENQGDAKPSGEPLPSDETDDTGCDDQGAGTLAGSTTVGDPAEEASQGDVSTQ